MSRRARCWMLIAAVATMLWWPSAALAQDGEAAAEVAGVVQAGGQGVDRDDLGAAEDGEASRDQADDALAEDGHPVAEADLGREHRVERDGPDAGEGADERVGATDPVSDLTTRVAAVAGDDDVTAVRR